MRHDCRLFAHLAIAVLLFHTAVLAAFNDIFQMKLGTEKGGCDGFAGDIPAIFDEAVLIIDGALQAINEYNTDFQVRKTALAFFNIQLSDDMSVPRDEKDSAMLLSVQQGFQELSNIAKTPLEEQKKIWMFCASDWLEKADLNSNYMMADDEGTFRRVETTDKVTGDFREVRFLEKAKDGKEETEEEENLRAARQSAYFSKDLKSYIIDDKNSEAVVKSCEVEGTSAYSTVQPSSSLPISKVKALTLCKNGFFGRYADRLDINQGKIGVYLDSFQPKSLTLIHELYHLGTLGSKSRDINSWTPPLDLQPKNQEGNANAEWPGNPENFVQSRNAADSSTNILLLALASSATVHKIDISNNPQTYALAALTMFLARNGAKLDYSTGLSRPLDAPIARPAEHPARRSILNTINLENAGGSLIAKEFRA
ncbi:hypothetical protein VTL71DRAFT_12880 [Oculimacula yallundae]|uniref:Lysine-specific metallo-endopeptidase domain-containing protein n=1 Tax=Oculimacula yallundae TaxID=86028 RepID=A0ABR4CNU3_9HELO